MCFSSGLIHQVNEVKQDFIFNIIYQGLNYSEKFIKCGKLCSFWVETLHLWWKQSTKHQSFTLQTWFQQYKWNSCFFVCVLHEALCHENIKMKLKGVIAIMEK